MVRLPSLQLGKVACATTNKGNEGYPIQLCLHLDGETDKRLVDVETIRNRKALKIREAARLRGDEGLYDDLLPEVKSSPAHVKKKLRQHQIQMKVLSGTGHIVKLPPQFCETGGDEAPDSPKRQNISHTGSWLDRRAFSTVNDVYSIQQGRTGLIADGRGELNDGDRAFLKRCKDALKKRFNGNIQIAWRKFDLHSSDSISINEFVHATSTLFKAFEARLLYRLIDVNSDGNVSFRELISLIDSA